MKRGYVVEAQTAPLDALDEKILQAVADVLFRDRQLAGPAPSANLLTRVLSVRASVDAESPEDALMTAIARIRAALKRAGLGEPELTEASVLLELPEDEHAAARDDLVGTPDVAERLGISRQRVAQLVAEPGRFPTPVTTVRGTHVWRWGDIADWSASGGRGAPGRMTALAAALNAQLAGRRNPELREAMLERLVVLANNDDEDAIEFLTKNPEEAFSSNGVWMRQVDSGRGAGIAPGARGSIVTRRRR